MEGFPPEIAFTKILLHEYFMDLPSILNFSINGC